MKKQTLLFGVLLMAGSMTMQYCAEDPTAEPQISQSTEKTYYCDKVPFCHGSIQSFVTLRDEKPVAIGVRLSGPILNGLPSDPANNIPEVRLKVPEQGKDIGIDHIDFGWNPQGHEPDPIYTLPHFDLHFYKVNSKDQAEVVPGPDPIQVSPQFIPQDYISGVVAVPNMGVHYVDSKAAEFNGSKFTSTFIYGFYRGQMTFLEPMFTREFLQSKPDFSAPVKQPAAFQKEGYYPSSYRIAYNSQTDEYIIAAEGLTHRNATP